MCIKWKPQGHPPRHISIKGSACTLRQEVTFPADMMYAVLFLVLTCLGQSARGSEIINGRNAEKNTMMYMASVQNKIRHHICGGFLVAEQFVLTAAHCYALNPTSVVLGTHNLKAVKDREMRYQVTTCKHPNFKNVLKGFDIMLLKLSRKVHLVKPIQLPKRKVQLKDKQQCHVAGWGYSKTGGTVVDNLQVVDVSIINKKECQKAWRKVERDIRLPSSIICAGAYRTKKGFCQGDSGGPLVCDGIPVGVVSANRRGICDYPDVPNIYTNLTKFLQWINKVIKNNGC
ncbi:mast cell protease 1A-like [Thalassophryne amazonica]|uniref:mast cell protease 1A-like n=1 Tax=Thalassophryne amazonica TaxID=390379 RepID=UPI0014711B29|nr:mast cell protease 1A-like [Thalassophryne amazonica]